MNKVCLLLVSISFNLFSQTVSQDVNEKEYWQSAWWISDFSPRESRTDGTYLFSCTYRSDDSPWKTFNIRYLSKENLIYGCPKTIWYDEVRQKWKVKDLR